MHAPHRRTFSGFTLVEMIVTLAVLAVLVSAGLPALSTLMANMELRAAHDRLFVHLSLARTAAISYGRRIVLCPSLNGAQCSGATNWTAGWIVFIDTNNNRQRELAEPVLRYGQLPETVRLNSSRARRAIRFTPSGASPGSNLTFRFCHQRDLPGRAIILSNHGRARSSRSEPRGGPVICA